ncbi:MAG: DUF1203 domain-containing protein [Gemmatimonadaceae bacterium]|jgi:hypothetical protein
MHGYRVVAVSDRTADGVRKTMKSPGYGHPAHTETATGYGPCRQCLRTFAIGIDRRILFTYDAFYGKEDLPLPGPVFIHEESCERYAEGDGFPADLLAHRLTLNAYGRGRQLVASRYVSDGLVEAEVERLLADANVDYIHVRDTVAGCYDFCIERTGRNENFSEISQANGGNSHE